MRSKKRRKSAADDGAGAESQDIKLASFERYQFLPHELQRFVLELACLLPSTSSSLVSASRSLFIPDVATATSLSIVSKATYNQVKTLLLGHITTTRPSTLYALHTTLNTRRDRADLVKSIHIGPLSTLPSDWFPLSDAFPPGEGWDQNLLRHVGRSQIWITSSLTQEHLPAWLKDKPAWGRERIAAAATGCREAAIRGAIRQASYLLQVDLVQEARSPSTTKVSAILEVQACLDLYLLDIRRIEDLNPDLKLLARPGARVPLPCRTGQCDHYPSLFIANAPRRPWQRFPPLAPPGSFKISRAMLMAHLARKDAPADRFDHPLVFLRSGFEVSVTPRLGRGHQYCSTLGARYELDSESWNIKEVHEKYSWPDLALLEEARRYQTWNAPNRPNYTTLINTGTMGSTLSLVRDILRRLPNLENLSLTGFLERTLDGSPRLLSPSLRRLSIGPYPRQWYIETNLSGLERLEKPRIAGAPLVC